MHRVEAGYFSLTGHSADGHDLPYLEWHQLDHMPEQYQLPGMVLGQRWGSTPACRAARSVEAGEWGEVAHVVCYLMGAPLDATVDEFVALGGRLARMGRFPHRMPSCYRGGLLLLAGHAAPRTLVSPEVVPFRPHRGIQLLVEQPASEEAAGGEGSLRRLRTEVLPALVAVPGVAGAWTFATSPSFRRPNFSEGDLRITVCYLDDDPPATARRMAPVLEGIWRTAPTRPLLAAPFESVLRWHWEGLATPAG